MKVSLNRNHLKIIALISMIIDHIGFYFMENSHPMRIIGRIAFPIFAFFIAQGYFYTRDKKKYVLLLLLFGIISQIPYFLVLPMKKEFNILITFFFSVVLIHLIEKAQKEKNAINIITLILYNLFLIALYFLNAISYGFFGIYVAVVFYFIKNDTLKYSLFALLIGLITLPDIIKHPHRFYSYVQLFALCTIPLLLLYNNSKGKLNLKWLFYIIYPTHLLLFYIIKNIFILH